MAAPKGNQFWKARSSHGRKPIFETPDALWDAACEYFQWVEDNPLWESRLVCYQGDSKVEELPKMRAMTMSGLCLFLDIDEQTFANYKSREDFFGVATNIEKVIRDQKFAGAAADLFNANIIARDLGLRDKSETELTGKDGAPVFQVIVQGADQTP